MRRSLLLVVAALIAIMLTPSLSSANGGATFDFGDEAYLQSGEEIQGSTVVWLGKKDVQALQDGPYYAYLVPDGKWIKPPNVPAGAIRVGTVDFRMITEKKAVATLSFVVPDLPSGRYGLPYCNEPCTRAGIGDLYAGSVLVARDAEVGALLVQAENADAKAASAQWRLKRAKRQIGRLEADLATAEGAAAELSGRVADLEERSRLASQADEAGPGVGPWLGAASGGIAVGFLVGRRRRRSPGGSPVQEAERILERVG
jgi:hypothetical protein